MATNEKYLAVFQACLYTPLLEKRLISGRKVPLFYEKSVSFL